MAVRIRHSLQRVHARDRAAVHYPDGVYEGPGEGLLDLFVAGQHSVHGRHRLLLLHHLLGIQWYERYPTIFYSGDADDFTLIIPLQFDFLFVIALPFLRHPEMFLYPITIFVVLYVLALILGINVSAKVLAMYFG